MKALLIILLLVCCYYIAVKIFSEHDLEVKENLIITESQNYDINLLYISPVSKYAFIEGTVRNLSDKSLKNISIIYLIGQDSVKAEIFSLIPGEYQKFKTNNCPIKSTSPGFSRLNISYDKEEY